MSTGAEINARMNGAHGTLQLMQQVADDMAKDAQRDAMNSLLLPFDQSVRIWRVIAALRQEYAATILRDSPELASQIPQGWRLGWRAWAAHFSR
jgi:hypothetical protein